MAVRRSPRPNEDETNVVVVAVVILCAIALALAALKSPGPAIAAHCAGLLIGWALCRLYGPRLDRWRDRHDLH